MAKRYMTLRAYYAQGWAMYTVCKGCKEFLYCRGKSRERMKCKECSCGPDPTD